MRGAWSARGTWGVGGVETFIERTCHDGEGSRKCLTGPWGVGYIPHPLFCDARVAELVDAPG